MIKEEMSGKGTAIFCCYLRCISNLIPPIQFAPTDAIIFIATAQLHRFIHIGCVYDFGQEFSAHFA